jgi:GDPmannose 4,6-dehydratase
VRIARGEQHTLALGNLDTRVDIGYAREYMEAAHAMLQLDKPDDFVISSGLTQKIGFLAECALGYAGLSRPRDRITQDERYYRPLGDTVRGDSTRARSVFGFEPKVSVFKLIEMIIDSAKEQP